jgi:hypothetical protein
MGRVLSFRQTRSPPCPAQQSFPLTAPQYIEADILFDAMYGLYKHRGIAVLPIHDAFVCRVEDLEIVTSVLKSTFEFKTGLRPICSVE